MDDALIWQQRPPPLPWDDKALRARATPPSITCHPLPRRPGTRTVIATQRPIKPTLICRRLIVPSVILGSVAADGGSRVVGKETGRIPEEDEDLGGIEKHLSTEADSGRRAGRRTEAEDKSGGSERRKASTGSYVARITAKHSQTRLKRMGCGCTSFGESSGVFRLPGPWQGTDLGKDLLMKVARSSLEGCKQTMKGA